MTAPRRHNGAEYMNRPQAGQAEEWRSSRLKRLSDSTRIWGSPPAHGAALGARFAGELPAEQAGCARQGGMAGIFGLFGPSLTLPLRSLLRAPTINSRPCQASPPPQCPM